MFRNGEYLAPLFCEYLGTSVLFSAFFWTSLQTLANFVTRGL